MVYCGDGIFKALSFKFTEEVESKISMDVNNLTHNWSQNVSSLSTIQLFTNFNSGILNALDSFEQSRVIAQSHGVTMKNLGLNFTEKVLIVLSFSLLAHYFVLTFFRVDGTESFVGQVEKIDFLSKGLFPMAKVKFAVINIDHPHIYGMTDADAVFGMMYVQCEDFFSKVEDVIIGRMGRESEVQGKVSI